MEPTALTQDDQGRFEYLLAAITGQLDPSGDIAIVSCIFDGREQVPVVVQVISSDPDEFLMLPLAILVDDALMARLSPGADVETVPNET